MMVKFKVVYTNQFYDPPPETLGGLIWGGGLRGLN